ncbi:TlpA family protein disulfide reductase [Frigoriflavimonas asaccharolytica]|uniref:Thiol-disulfide isomerase/thioredoxin n=1 Tax=Frigoriflavimonas asaccharolytica TaxID=2735899 RepID=A0A8J8G8M7_9FLAO|nr:TlpA disulfide reductase family protein [Frigoriflavimonas asaccharolytica]NRS92961.1 thiol-disulfide isomerase/thioredoxin [Frigoriflavimonas asaccharolytica]
MNFVKKYWFSAILLVFVFVIFAFPNVKTSIRDAFFPIAAVESALKLDDTDYDIALKGMNVPDANLKDFKGKKTVFLNFWGTWCAPCRTEWPSIQELYDAKKGKVDFVLIAVQDEEAAVKKFLQENNYSVPVYIAQSPLSKNLLPSVFPTTYLLDIDGRILLKETSTRNWNSETANEFIDNVQR